MALKRLLADLSIISKLGTNPGIDDGLSEEQLKAKFDEAANIIKDYLNNYLILEIEKTVDVESLLSDILDVTLSLEDKAANAKATGEKIGLVQQTANAALPKSGGNMTGPLVVLTPTETGHAANKGYVDGTLLTITLPVSGWVGDSAPYTQTVAAEVTAADRPEYWPVHSEDNETNVARKEAFAVVDYLETADGSVTVECYEDKPEIDLPLYLEVRR